MVVSYEELTNCSIVVQQLHLCFTIYCQHKGNNTSVEQHCLAAGKIRVEKSGDLPRFPLFPEKQKKKKTALEKTLLGISETPPTAPIEQLHPGGLIRCYCCCCFFLFMPSERKQCASYLHISSIKNKQASFALYSRKTLSKKITIRTVITLQAKNWLFGGQQIGYIFVRAWGNLSARMPTSQERTVASPP
jgi:hypothetical protein